MSDTHDPAAGAPYREGGGDCVSPAPPAAAPSLPAGGGSPTPPARPQSVVLRGHAESLDCWCCPVLAPFGAEWLILHGDVTQLVTGGPVPLVVASIAAEVEGPYVVHEAEVLCRDAVGRSDR